jgi:phosphatidate cytidylyltransferase
MASSVRVLSAAVLVAVVASTVWLLPATATVVLAAVAAALAGSELALLFRRLGDVPPPAFVGLAAATVAAAFALRGDPSIVAADLLGSALVAAFIATALVALASGPPAPQAMNRPAVVALAMIYLGLPLGAAAWIRVVHGPGVLTWLVAVIALSDSAQYYTGRVLGRRKLAPLVSPAKTVEGAIGGLIAAAAAGAALATYWRPAGVSLVAAAGCAVFLAAFGIAGDLFESLLKRSAGVKDSSTLIPGHGGVLDRIDAYLFAAPVFYLFLRFIE